MHQQSGLTLHPEHPPTERSLIEAHMVKGGSHPHFHVSSLGMLSSAPTSNPQMFEGRIFYVWILEDYFAEIFSFLSTELLCLRYLVIS
jgi:hypothetical protein